MVWYIVAARPELVPLAVILDRRVVRTGAGASRSSRDVHVARAVHGEGGGGIVSFPGAVVAGHPELVPLGVILDRRIVRTGAWAKRSPRDIHVSRQVHHEGIGRIVSVARTIVAGHPELVPPAVILHGRIIVAAAGAHRTTGDIHIATVIQRECGGKIGVAAWTVIARHPKLVARGIILDRCVIVARPETSRIPRDVHIADAVHHQRARRVHGAARAVVTSRPDQLPLRVILDRRIVRTAA